ncbi:MAG: T9SS type A sorting domain-containing protein [Bacteroidales bacterium]|nr:T9SS type A sorting domain-containing protein [Bacteroidales bacterium]
MKTILKLSIVVFSIFLLIENKAVCQMPAAISIEPANATVYDEITLTFDPEEACFLSGSLVGFPYVAMHSGITINGNQWQNVIGFDATGANGQSPILTLNADDTYSIIFIPFEFYGFAPGANVTQICAVFNNGSNWNEDGRDFESGGVNCIDFFIPILPGTPPVIPYLQAIEPDNGDQGASLNVQIFCLNTHFQEDTTTAWLNNDSEIININSIYAVNDTLISAQLSIPGDALSDFWHVNIYNSIDDTVTLLNGFFINDTTTFIPPMPPAISIYPPDATVFDNITLTFDTKLSCPEGDLFNADSVMMHSGVTINGEVWLNAIYFDSLGVNGQAPKLTYNGDSTWSIAFLPSAFYGIDPGVNVEAINCVFNGGNWLAGEGKDFDDEGNCVDFYIPLTLVTDVSVYEINTVNLFPNPVKDNLHIRSNEPIKSIAVYSSLGIANFKETEVNSTFYTIKTTDLSDGIYVVQIQFTSGDLNTYKILKK